MVVAEGGHVGRQTNRVLVTPTEYFFMHGILRFKHRVKMVGSNVQSMESQI